MSGKYNILPCLVLRTPLFWRAQTFGKKEFICRKMPASTQEPDIRRGGAAEAEMTKWPGFAD